MPAGEYSVIEHRKPIQEIYLAWKSIEQCEIEFCEDKDNVFVEVIAYHGWNPCVPVSTLKDQEPQQELELRYSKVCWPHSLRAFFAFNPNSYVCLHNHRDIISAISNSQGYPWASWLENID